MKVLYVLNDTLHRGGTESVVLNYLEHIDRNLVQIDFVLNTTEDEMNNNPLVEELKKKGIKLFAITPRRQSSKLNKCQYLNILKNEQYDIVHAHADAANCYFLKVAKVAGVKIRVSHSHNTKHQIRINSPKKLMHFAYLEMCRKRLLKQATHYMACSKEAGKWLYGKRYLDNDKVYILNNAVDINRFSFDSEKRDKIREELNIKDKIVLGHVGRFVEQKNHEFLIEVFKELSLKIDNSVLLLVGDGERRKAIEDKVDELGIKDKVIFYGTTQKVADIYNAMDVFAFPSLFEGLSVVMVEAQCNGLHCLVSDVDTVSKETAITELVKFETLDKDKWVDSLKHTPVERIDCKDIIRLKGYDIETEATRLVQFYEDICKG